MNHLLNIQLTCLALAWAVFLLDWIAPYTAIDPATKSELADASVTALILLTCVAFLTLLAMIALNLL